MSEMGAANAGGSAMAGGQRFQARVTAWWAARILLQTPIGRVYGLPHDSTAERIACETDDGVDDVRVDLGAARLYGQCKRSMKLSKSVGSEWASVLKQFYNEWHLSRTVGMERRLCLFYEQPNGNLHQLARILDRYRGLSTGASLVDAARNAAERTRVQDLEDLLDKIEQHARNTPLAGQREEILRHSYIVQLRLGEGGPDYLGIKDALQEVLLVHPQDTTRVLDSLHCLADDLLAERGERDRLALRRRLQNDRVQLRDSVDYRSDFESLRTWSETEMANQERDGRHCITVAGHEVSINRPATAAIDALAATTSFLLIGSAGVGKTGCLLLLARRLCTARKRVWYWAADSLPDRSIPEMASHLALRHEWAGILAEAASGPATYLIVDGLDGVRDRTVQHAYRTLMKMAKHAGITVVASIRTFDLQYSSDLREVFKLQAGQALDPSYARPEFANVCHLAVPEIGDSELDQVLTQLPDIRQTLDIAPNLRPVIRNLFSLDLLSRRRHNFSNSIGPSGSVSMSDATKSRKCYACS